MKAMFDFAAANRDAASLRASTLYDQKVRGANFKVGDKVWVLDQVKKVGSNPKLRLRQLNIGTTVIRLLSKGRRRNKENAQPELSRATESAEPPVQRHKLQDLTNRTSKVKQMNIIEEIQVEEITQELDEQMP